MRRHRQVNVYKQQYAIELMTRYCHICEADTDHTYDSYNGEWQCSLCNQEESE